MSTAGDIPPAFTQPDMFLRLLDHCEQLLALWEQLWLWLAWRARAAFSLLYPWLLQKLVRKQETAGKIGVSGGLSGRERFQAFCNGSKAFCNGSRAFCNGSTGGVFSGSSSFSIPQLPFAGCPKAGAGILKTLHDDAHDALA